MHAVHVDASHMSTMPRPKFGPEPSHDGWAEPEHERFH